jgi:hypothetical protein
VHIPKSAISAGAGLSFADLAVDPYYLKWSRQHERSAVTQFFYYFNRDTILETFLASLPIPEPKTYTIAGDDYKAFNELHEIYKAHPLFGSDFHFYHLISLMTGLVLREKDDIPAQIKTCSQETIAKSLRGKAIQHLSDRGLIIPQTNHEQIERDIREILLRGNFGGGRDALLAQLLNAPDGLALIRITIEKMLALDADCLSQLSFATLFHIPQGCSLNLFRAFAADPFYAGWMLGFSIQTIGGNINFISDPSPFSARVTALLSEDAHKRAIEDELEHLIYQPGALIFWMRNLSIDPEMVSIFQEIRDYLFLRQDERDADAYGRLRLQDNLADVLWHMQDHSNKTFKITAKSFLSHRLDQQLSHSIWDGFWRTCCYIKDYEFEFEFGLLDRFPRLLESLRSRDNWEIFVFINQKRYYTVEAVSRKLELSFPSRSADSDDAAVSARASSLLPSTPGFFGSPPPASAPDAPGRPAGPASRL